MPARKIQVGQVWKKEGSSDNFLVTKVYNEALATYAVLRKTGAETEPPTRVKVTQSGASQVRKRPCRSQQSPQPRQE